MLIRTFEKITIRWNEKAKRIRGNIKRKRMLNQKLSL